MQKNPWYDRVKDKLAAGERLTREDGIEMMQARDLLALGELAREVKRRKTGDMVFFNVNRHINITNICVSRCKFCAFSRDPGEAGAYLMTMDEMMRRGEEALRQGATELHIVSALHPELPFSFYVEAIRRLHQAFPSMHLQAFTAVEIDYFSRISGLDVEEVLRTLKEAGLSSLPGGGAELFSPRIRKALCPNKASGQRWLEVMEAAHRLGIKSNATMLYGHVETIEERIEHLLQLRDLQDKTGGFQSFIPLRFHPENTGL
ncbi:MAG: CofH family radical SAM protein, partial [Syntrophomonadaceae bacterium]|nr:CofH family radical SAM protein [Syntrophomonadaceae bacterium]